MLNTDFYSGAIVRLATLQKERSQPGQLLFATVSLLPRGRPLPFPMKGLDRCSVGKTGQTVYFRRALMSVNDAVEWYRNLGSGDEKSPVPSKHEERNSNYDGVNIVVSQLADDPVWPYLGLPIGEGGFSHPTAQAHPAPFAGNASDRIHRRFGSQDGFELMLEDDKALSFIARRLHVDLRLYREYLGSVSLVAPDPVLKKIECFMISASVDRGERIFYRFVPRAGVSLAGLKITTFDKQSHLLTDVRTQNIPRDGILDIDKGDCIGAYGYVVSHDEHGVLAYCPPYPFLRQMGLSMQVGAPEKKVSVPVGDSANSPRMEYLTAQPSGNASQSLIGDKPRIANASSRIANASSRRENIARAKQYGQRWFADGSREEAMRFIQGELRRAKRRVMIADPYLAGLQLGQFLYAVSPENISVTLLSSSLAFKSNDFESSKIEDLSRRVAQLEKDAKVTAKVYVLRSNMLHDRFLVIDDTVWFLGNSLNTLGEKASLIVKIPNPDDVIDKIELMLRNAVTFEEFKKDKGEKNKDVDP